MHRLLAFLLALPLLAQIVPIDPNSPVASGPAIINSNFTFLASSKVAIWSGSGAPGSIPLSVLGDLYVNTSGAPPVAYQCMRATACNAVGSGNWQLVGNVVTGGTCTNQVVSAISTSAVPTCVTITSAYVNSSIALTGVDINTSSQVTVTHLASPLPVLQGGTGTTTPALVQGTNITITGSWPNQTINASGTGGTGNAGATVSVTNSATPTFTCPSSTAGTTVFFHLASALATNITGSTLSGCTGSSTLSSILNFTFTQASSGGPYTIVMPAGFSQACPVSPIASADTNMSFSWDGTTAHLISCSASAGPSVGLEQAAPSITPSSGYELGWLDSTGNFPRYKNSAGTIFQAAKEGTGIRQANGANAADTFSDVAFAAQTDAATVTWAIGSALIANATLTFTAHSGSRTLNITGPSNGGSYVLWMKQDGTGGEGLTLGTGCTWKVSNGGSGAITPSTGPNVVDVLAFTYDGTNCYANFNKNFD